MVDTGLTGRVITSAGPAAPCSGERTYLVTLSAADTDSDADTDGQPDVPPVQDSDSSSDTPRRRSGRRTRWILVGALVLLLAGGGVGAWALFFRTPTPSTTYRTVTLAKETLKQTVSATGTLNPARESDLSFSSSGTVTSVEVEAGDLVDKGQELASIDDNELQIDYDSAKASLTEAEESLSDLQDDDDSTDTAIAAAQAGVEVKKNAVKQAKAALKAATLVSPIAGKVAEVTVAEGDTVSGTASTTGSSGNADTGTGTGTSSSSSSDGSASSTAAVTVISNGTFRVTTSVSNADVTSIKKGLQATITPTSSTEAVFGTVSSVGVVASSSSATSSSGSGSSTFPVTIEVTGTHKTLLPGSSATVAITTKQLTDVISVPTQAVSTVDGRTVVQKLVAGQQVQTPVKLGATVGAATVVTSGLAVGDQVVLASFRVQSGSGANGSGRTGQGTGGLNGGTGGGFPQGGFPPGNQLPVQQGQQQGSR